MSNILVILDESYPENVSIGLRAVVVDPESRKVGTPTTQIEISPGGNSLVLCYVPRGTADTSKLREWLESHKTQLALEEVCKGYVRGDDNLGSLTPAASKVLEAEASAFNRHTMPVFWSPEDYFTPVGLKY